MGRDFGSSTPEEMGITPDGKEKSAYDKTLEKGLYDKFTFEEAMAYETGSSLQTQEHSLKNLLNYQYLRARPGQAKYSDLYASMNIKLGDLSNEQIDSLVQELEQSIKDKSKPKE